ncbi:MAG: rubredoxin-like domain-containing protein [Anaerovoracaceae bacterium]
MVKKVTDSVVYIGADDHELDLFEGHYIVPNGMAYNSYAVLGDKTAVIDTIDKSKTEEWLSNVEEVFGGKAPDYLIVQHMEPDHSASIEAFAEKYKDTVIVGNKKTFRMIGQFFPGLNIEHTLEVDNGDTLDLGSRSLSFLFAPMVHWPEVMMTYDSADKIIFSADAFGKFGALDTEEDWACEARRYYIGIVGKYGAQVQSVLKAIEKLDIDIICPLHGPVLNENLGYYIDLYDTWSSYTPESEGVCICYTSVYGNTKKAVEMLKAELEKKGVEVVVSDLARCDMAEAVEDAFRYDRLVLATTTYNGDIFPYMRHFIDALKERNFQNRSVSFIENGSWGPTAMRVMKAELEKSKNLKISENNVTIKSALNDESIGQIKALADEICQCYKGMTGEGSCEIPQEKKSKGFVCDICGYIYEGDTLPEDFVCPICKVGADKFSPVE